MSLTVFIRYSYRIYKTFNHDMSCDQLSLQNLQKIIKADTLYEQVLGTKGMGLHGYNTRPQGMQNWLE